MGRAGSMTRLPFWKTKTLDQMTRKEWESLCDGCAKCCIVKFEDEETGALAYTNLHCKLLDGSTCQCSDYRNRKKYVPDCVKLTPESVAAVDWLPDSCAYRLVQDGKDLPDWHHLVCGDRNRIHEEGHSVRGRTISEEDISEEDQEDYIIDWEGSPP
ncbi:YcgN family cysteine cluster protein [Hyphomonas sp.]|uniref:YcgN family cysteine cluster protein n=1 Tax=Hyphomonas sp. TaxID=87 RepID=UPI00391D58AB